jgi:hypothetical protein
MGKGKNISNQPSLEQFLLSLFIKRRAYSSLYCPIPREIPAWAAQCSHLLYSYKSLPVNFAEPGELYSDKLYLCYDSHTPNSVGLMGQTKTHKKINRTFKVEQNGSSITVQSKHKDIQNNCIVTYEGKGKNFEAAINDYFLKSDLKNPEYSLTIDHVQREGDAFILFQTIQKEGYHHIAHLAAEVIKRVFSLINPEDHSKLMLAIQEAIKGIKPEIKKLAHHYDEKLWSVIESICNFHDKTHLTAERKNHRDFLIAELCSNLLRGVDIVPRLQEYIEAITMHSLILEASNQDSIHDTLKKILENYRQEKFLPEVKEHGDLIKAYYEQFQQLSPINLSPKL